MTPQASEKKQYNEQIGVTSIAFSKSKRLRDILISHFPHSKFNDELKRFTKDELFDFLKDCHGAIVGLDLLDHITLSGLKTLQSISKYGVGLDNIDLIAAEKNSIKVMSSPGVNKRSVSELVIGNMICLLRNIWLTGHRLKSGTWQKQGGTQLSGKVVAIIGFGNIGQDVAKLLAPFNCKILIVDILDRSNECTSPNIQQVDLNQALKLADVVSVHVPLTAITMNMINKQNIKKMKPSAILINTSRGEVIDQIALKSALVSERLAGAALDVFSPEPPTDHQFLSLPNLIPTPHIGGNSKEAVQSMGEAAIRNLIDSFSN